MSEKRCEVIVVGGGHAGTEACSCSARMGCRTLLITMRKETVGEMSCNPAIGGLGKGHLVKEIDALGGIMARAADYGGIHFKRLNTSKGPAVHSSRAQEDRKKYKEYIQNALSEQDNLDIISAKVNGLIIKNNRIRGVITDKGDKIYSKAVILCPGTFLNGILHFGMKNYSGGRIGDKCSKELSDEIKRIGFKTMRFKTGTCARLDGKTIDFSKMKQQKPDKKPIPFSFFTDEINREQVPCYITYTNNETHEIIRSGFDRSPLFTGVIEGRGVRYCPSIEDKIVKFAHMERHHVFMEPEGIDTDLYYPNGISTSLPQDIQDKFIRTIPGLEKVKIARYGYGIEHDVVDPFELYPTLQTKKISGLYFAGQINCTTGYEEAAAQGIIAGINAAAQLLDKEPLILSREQAYIGVLIDDLVTKSTTEPYRMFTSRAEYRLLLREDNAHLRLYDIGHKYGSLGDNEFKKINNFKNKLDFTRNLLHKIKIKPSEIGFKEFSSDKKRTAAKLLKTPEIKFDQIRQCDKELKKIDKNVARELDIEFKYSGYIKRQRKEVEKIHHMENLKIPEDIDYSQIEGLSREEIEKLKTVSPINLGQASRISGVTPAAVSAIMIYIKSRKQLNV
ncbi:MAG: tRNA uridine-5-carboxymethylaminomethyl(34) synthesis enzyme MnmG [Elusimicrobiota bacterium]